MVVSCCRGSGRNFSSVLQIESRARSKATQSSDGAVRVVVTGTHPIDAEMKRSVDLRTREPSVGHIPPPCELGREIYHNVISNVKPNRPVVCPTV